MTTSYFIKMEVLISRFLLDCWRVVIIITTSNIVWILFTIVLRLTCIVWIDHRNVNGMIVDSIARCLISTPTPTQRRSCGSMLYIDMMHIIRHYKHCRNVYVRPNFYHVSLFEVSSNACNLTPFQYCYGSSVYICMHRRESTSTPWYRLVNRIATITIIDGMNNKIPPPLELCKYDRDHPYEWQNTRLAFFRHTRINIGMRVHYVNIRLKHFTIW